MQDWITFPDGRRGRLEWAGDEARADYWQQLLAHAHGQILARPHCDCLAQGRRLPLSVRERIRVENGRTVHHYFLARMPFEGPLHAPGCPFHQHDPARSGRRGYAEGVICELHDGRLRILLAGGLLKREPALGARVESSGEHRRSAGSFRQTQMTLLGLLQLLWEQARLNVLTSADIRRRRWWPSVRAALLDAASTIMVGTRQLDRHLAAIGFGDDEGPGLLEATIDDVGTDHRVLLLGLVDHISCRRAGEGDDGQPMLCLIFDGSDPFNLYVRGSADLAQHLEGSFPWAWRELQRPRRDRAIRVVALVLATVNRHADSGRLFARAESVALMEVGPALIPVVSTHELVILQALIDAGRQFRKPLRFDADREIVLPDFELRDTADPRGTPMEVFGRSDESYLARLKEKRAYYDATYSAAHWWSWDATSTPVWPPFPPAAQSMPPVNDGTVS